MLILNHGDGSGDAGVDDQRDSNVSYVEADVRSLPEPLAKQAVGVLIKGFPKDLSLINNLFRLRTTGRQRCFLRGRGVEQSDRVFANYRFLLGVVGGSVSGGEEIDGTRFCLDEELPTIVDGTVVDGLESEPWRAKELCCWK